MSGIPPVPQRAPDVEATLWELCRDKEWRHRFAFMVLGRSLARQIHVMRRGRGWSQKQLAERAGLSVMTVVYLEQWCGNASIHTLVRIAAAFDVALIIRFISWGEFFLTLGRGIVAPLSFDEECALLESALSVPPQAVAKASAAPMGGSHSVGGGVETQEDPDVALPQGREG